MAFPETIAVKLSSEDAGAIAITRVVVETMTPAELVEVILGVAGKDVERVRETLARGSIVSGATRFRWPPVEAASAEIEAVFRRFPDPDPARAFQPAACKAVALRGTARTVSLERESTARRGFLRRRTAWEALMKFAGESAPDYAGYSYRDRADRYRLNLSPAAARELAAFGISAFEAEYLVER